MSVSIFRALALVLSAMALILASALPARAEVDAKAEVAAALFAASATHAAELRAADQRMNVERVRIESVAQKARAGEAAAKAELVRLQQAFVAELAKRDVSYAREIAVFRVAVEDIASTTEGAAALAKFNAGDKVGALEILDDLQQARSQARQAAVSAEDAAEQRQIAQLALQAVGDGVTAQDTLDRFAAIVALDPSVSGDWVALSRLNYLTGRIARAIEAGEEAVKVARSEDEKINALQELAERHRLAWRSSESAKALTELVKLLQPRVDAAPDDEVLGLRYAEALISTSQILGPGYYQDEVLRLARPRCSNVQTPELGEWAAHTCARIVLVEANSFLLRVRRMEMGPTVLRGIALISDYVDRYPTSLRLRERWGDMVEMRAVWLGAVGNREEALADWEEALAIQREAVARDPTSAAGRLELMGRLSAVAARIYSTDLARAQSLTRELIKIIDTTPVEEGDIDGLEDVSTALQNASLVMWVAGDYPTSAEYDRRQILISGELFARFPTAPRTLTIFDGKLNSLNAWDGVKGGGDVWRSMFRSSIAHFEAGLNAPKEGYDWRFPLAFSRARACVFHSRVGEFDVAEQYCESALVMAEALAAEQSENDQARRMHAYILVNQAAMRGASGDKVGQLETLDRSISVMSTDNGLNARANFHSANEAWELALVDRDRFNQRYPGSASSLAQGCRLRAILDREIDYALAQCRQALELADNIQTRLNLGMALLRTEGGGVEAETQYDHVLSQAPKNAEALYGRGLARYLDGNVEQGEADMAAAREIDAALIEKLESLGLTPIVPTPPAEAVEAPEDLATNRLQMLEVAREKTARLAASRLQIGDVARGKTAGEEEGEAVATPSEPVAEWVEEVEVEEPPPPAP